MPSHFTDIYYAQDIRSSWRVTLGTEDDIEDGDIESLTVEATSEDLAKIEAIRIYRIQNLLSDNPKILNIKQLDSVSESKVKRILRRITDQFDEDLGEFVDESYNFDQTSKSGKTLKPHKHPHPPGGPRQYTGGSKLKRAVIGTAIGGAVPLALAGVPALKALRTLGRVSKRRKFDELSDDLYTFDQTAKSGRPLAAHKHPHPPGGPRVYTGKGPGGGRGTPFNKGEKAFLKVQREIGNPNPNKTLRIIGLPKEYNPKTGVFTPSKRPKRKRRLGNILGR